MLHPCSAPASPVPRPLRAVHSRPPVSPPLIHSSLDLFRPHPANPKPQPPPRSRPSSSPSPPSPPLQPRLSPPSTSPWGRRSSARSPPRWRAGGRLRPCARPRPWRRSRPAGRRRSSPRTWLRIFVGSLPFSLEPVRACSPPRRRAGGRLHPCARPRPWQRSRPAGRSSPRTWLRIFVGNLPFSVDSAQLAGLFEQAGSVEMVEVIYDKLTGRSRGFGFVTMSSVEEVEAAVEQFNGYVLDGRSLKVNSGPAPPRDQSSPRGPRGEANRVPFCSLLSAKLVVRGGWRSRHLLPCWNL